MKKICLTLLAFSAFCLSAREIEIVAHRGEPTLAPENTLPSLKLAYELGAQVVETDFWDTESGIVVCMHCPKTMKKIYGIDKDVEKLTKNDVAASSAGHSEKWKGKFDGAKIPMLEEVLAVVPKSKKMEAEIKRYTPEYAKKFDDARKKAGKNAEQFIILSFDINALEDFHKKYPQYPIKLNYSAKIKGGKVSPDIETIKNDIKRTGAKFVTMGNFKNLPKEYFEEIKKEGVKLHLWIVDSMKDLLQAYELGADIVTSNRASGLHKDLELIKGLELK